MDEEHLNRLRKLVNDVTLIKWKITRANAIANIDYSFDSALLSLILHPEYAAQLKDSLLEFSDLRGEMIRCSDPDEFTDLFSKGVKLNRRISGIMKKLDIPEPAPPPAPEDLYG